MTHTATTKKIIAAIVAVIVAVGIAVVVGVTSAHAGGSGTADDPYTSSELCGDVETRKALERADNGDPVFWIKQDNGFKKCDFEITGRSGDNGTIRYKNIGWLSTDATDLDLQIKITCNGDASSGAFNINPDTGKLAGKPSLGGVGGTVKYEMKAFKAGTNTQVACYFPMWWKDIDQGWNDSARSVGGVSMTGEGVAFNATQVVDVVEGSKHTKHDGHYHGSLSFDHIDGSWSYTWDRFAATGLKKSSSGNMRAWYADHWCGGNGIHNTDGKGGEIDRDNDVVKISDGSESGRRMTYNQCADEMDDYTVDDSNFAFAAKLPASGAFDLYFGTSSGGGSIGFDAPDLSIESDNCYLQVKKQSSNPSATNGLSPTYYDFTKGSGTTFEVKTKSVTGIASGKTIGHFVCRRAEGNNDSNDYCTVIRTNGTVTDDTKLNLPVGTYTITETIDPTTGYLNKGKYLIDGGNERAWSGSADVTVTSGGTVTLTVKNEPMARLDLTKTSDEQSHWSYGLATYSRAGAVYGVYEDINRSTSVKDAADSSAPNKLTTFYYKVDSSGSLVDGSGVKISKVKWEATDGDKTQKREQLTSKVTSNVMMLEAGTYYVYEETASEGYTLDRGRTASGSDGASDFVNYKLTDHTGSRATTSTVTGYGVSQSSYPGMHKVVLKAGELTTVKSSEPPSESPIHIYKNDASFKYLAATGKNAACANFLHGGSDWRAQGDATLTGAWYQVNYYDGYYTSIPSATPTYSWTLRTGTKSKESGEAFIGTETVGGKEETHNIAGRSSASLLNNGGTATVPLGTITITELKPPQGYTMKNASLADPYVYLSQTRRVNQTTVKANFPDAYKRAFATTTTADASVASVRTYTVGTNNIAVGLDANIDVNGNLEVFNVVIRADAHLQKSDWDETQLRDGYDPGNPWRVPDWSNQKPEGNATLKGSVFEIVNSSVNPVISPTDGSSIIWPGTIADGSLSGPMPTGDTPITVDKRSSGINCYVTTDEKGYATTKAGAGVNNYVTAWKKGARNNETAYTATDGNTRAWTTPSTWTGALAYGTYVTQEVKEPDYGYLLNPGYRGKVVTRVNKADDLIKTTYAGDPATWHSPDEAKKYWWWKWYRDEYRAAPLPAPIV